MKSNYKTFFICLLSELLIALIFRQSNWLWFNNEIFLNHIIERILITIIYPIIWLIWENKEKNTKYLKISLIIIEIYLFLLIFVQDWSNFNNREFLILYITILLIIKETFYKRPQKRQTFFLLSIYFIISSTIIGIWFLMRYREPIDMESIFNSIDYKLTTNFNDKIKDYYTSISLKNDFYSKNISILSWKNNYNIIKNMDYTLTFSSKKNDKNDYIIIQDQLWNILKIYPQSLIKFSTKNKQIQFIDYNRKSEYYSINSEFPEELNDYKLEHNNKIKEYILSFLPSMLRNNPKLQKISVYYTKFIWKIFPFRYKENVKILEEYIPYFSLNEQKEEYRWESLKKKFSIIKNNWNIWEKNTNWRNNYRIF